MEAEFAIRQPSEQLFEVASTMPPYRRMKVAIMIVERDMIKQEQEDTRRAAWQVLLAGCAAAVVTGVFQLAVALVALQPPAPNTSQCVLAIRNVTEAADAGVKRSDPVMAAVNSPDVDRQCGTEEEILTAIGR